MAEIRFRNVPKRRDGSVGVDNFDLVIRGCEFLVLLGSSGRGRTASMRMIAGPEVSTDGEISIDEKVVNDLEPGDLDVAMVFQSYAPCSNMNAYDNTCVPLEIREADPEVHDDVVRRASSMVDLGDLCAVDPPNFLTASANAFPWPVRSHVNPTCF